MEIYRFAIVFFWDLSHNWPLSNQSPVSFGLRKSCFIFWGVIFICFLRSLGFFFAFLPSGFSKSFMIGCLSCFGLSRRPIFLHMFRFFWRFFSQKLDPLPPILTAFFLSKQKAKKKNRTGPPLFRAKKDVC